MNTTSVSLLERLRQPGADEAWTRFVQLYTPLLYYWARRLGLREEDAADLVQDVFTVLVRKLPEFNYDRDRSFRSWLHTVFRNKWHETGRRQADLLPGAGPGGLSGVASPDNVAALGESEFRQHLMMRALQLMQADFEPATWKACWEHAVCGRPAADVAQELDLTVNAVYLATSRVLRRLRQELAGLLDDAPGGGLAAARAAGGPRQTFSPPRSFS
jgi:RNA polymerase sigma-70 factor (ECF subfamily)